LADNAKKRGKIMRLFYCLALTLLFCIATIANAVDLINLDIGTAALVPGETVVEDDQYTITAAGHDIWGNADGFRFVYLELEGDFDASVQITFFQRGIHEWAKAGLMARDTLDANSANFLSTAAESAAFGAQISWRSAAGDRTFEWNLWEQGGPMGFEDDDWIRLKREGDDFTGFYHADGDADWIPMDTVTISMDEPILVGMIVTSHVQNTLTTATFANFTVDNAKVKFPTTAVELTDKLPVTWGDIKR
jgi:hypothetical protein